jgi:hypothetical protein
MPHQFSPESIVESRCWRLPGGFQAAGTVIIKFEFKRFINQLLPHWVIRAIIWGMTIMNPSKKLSSVALAATAATLLSIAPLNVSASEHDHASGRCMGANSCKEQSFCHTATTSCAGMNSCKGQGWIKATKMECEEKGGKYEG